MGCVQEYSAAVNHAYLSGLAKKLGFLRSKYTALGVLRYLSLEVKDRGKQRNLKDQMPFLMVHFSEHLFHLSS